MSLFVFVLGFDKSCLVFDRIAFWRKSFDVFWGRRPWLGRGFNGLAWVLLGSCTKLGPSGVGCWYSKDPLVLKGGEGVRAYYEIAKFVTP